MLFLKLLYLSLLLSLSGNRLLLYAGVVKQPLRQEINGVCRLRFVHDSKTFGNDKAKLILLYVGGIGMFDGTSGSRCRD